jgi:hypothetical protein
MRISRLVDHERDHLPDRRAVPERADPACRVGAIGAHDRAASVERAAVTRRAGLRRWRITEPISARRRRRRGARRPFPDMAAGLLCTPIEQGGGE